jgi:hypothetical protein
MSIAGYLACGRNERDRKEELERALGKRREQVGRKEPRVQHYRSVGEYDPVLRTHCRVEFRDFRNRVNETAILPSE